MTEDEYQRLYALHRPDNVIAEIAFTALSRDRPVRFIQVGANDGIRNDPVYPFVKKFGWTGVLIEPHRETYKKLKKNYSGVTGLDFMNIAVSSSNGKMTLYVPEGRTGLSTLQIDQANQFGSQYTASQHSVDTRRLDTLLRKGRIGPCDLLVVDTEGHDATVLDTVDWKNMKIVMVFFEHKHLESVRYIDTTERMKHYNFTPIKLLNNTLLMHDTIFPKFPLGELIRKYTELFQFFAKSIKHQTRHSIDTGHD